MWPIKFDSKYNYLRLAREKVFYFRFSKSKLFNLPKFKPVKLVAGEEPIPDSEPVYCFVWIRGCEFLLCYEVKYYSYLKLFEK